MKIVLVRLRRNAFLLNVYGIRARSCTELIFGNLKNVVHIARKNRGYLTVSIYEKRPNTSQKMKAPNLTSYDQWIIILQA